MTPDEYCADKLRRSGSSFGAAFRFLPAQRRRALNALYAFCREVDDAVDDCREPSVAQAKLDWWESELERVGREAAAHPAALALQAARRDFNLPLEQLQEIIEGMRMDLGVVRYADFTALRLYCHRAAGVVGLLAAEIFGYRDHHTQRYAHLLGLACQLTNIIRDVGEDARRNRIYLPQDEMAMHGVSEADIIARRHTPALLALLQAQGARAEEHYRLALDALPACDRKAQRPGLIMAAIYRHLLHTMAADDYRVLDGRCALTPATKLRLAMQTWLRASLS